MMAMLIGTTSEKAADPDDRDQRDEHLLGGVGRRRDDVGGEHGQGGRACPAAREDCRSEAMGGPSRTFFSR